MSRISRSSCGYTLDDSHEFKEGEGHSISESLEVIAMEFTHLNALLELIAINRGELEE